MKTIKPIFLPGTDRQFKILASQVKLEGKSVLIIGGGTVEIAYEFIENRAINTKIIVEDNDSLIDSRMLLRNNNNISVSMMEFDSTDFQDEQFDLVFAQGSITNKSKNKIVKEIKRILKPGGIFCVGENVVFSIELPVFIKDIFLNSGITPAFKEDFIKFYTDRKFEILYEHDLSTTLKDFYKLSSSILNQNIDTLSEQEKSYYKKMLKQISHESNVYLNLGGDDYFGFMMLVLKKGI